MLVIVLFFLLLIARARTKKATGFSQTRGMEVLVIFCYDLMKRKKPRVLEFARGCLPFLGKAKYKQAHSALVIHCR